MENTMTFQKGNKVNLGRKGWKHTTETKRKMSKSQKGRKAWNKGKQTPEETKKKMSEAHKGSKNYMFGVHRYGCESPNWKGGETKRAGDGRVLMKVNGHPFASKNGYMLRSRLVMEKKLGRYLEPNEVVHHINFIVDDDRPKNLQLFANPSAHTTYHMKLRYYM